MADEVATVETQAEKPTLVLYHDIALRAPFDGWKATMQVRRVPARVLIDLQSGQFARQLETVKRLTKSHNFVDEATGEVLEDLSDAPIEAIVMLTEMWGETVSSLPQA